MNPHAKQDGAYIRGLFLEGARWDADLGSLNESKPKQLYTPLPVLHLNPERFRVNPEKGVYRCPVYKVRWKASMKCIGVRFDIVTACLWQLLSGARQHRGTSTPQLAL